jgi:hypothetical protein
VDHPADVRRWSRRAPIPPRIESSAAAFEDAGEEAGLGGFAFGFEFGADARADGVQDVLGLVENRSGTAVVEPLRFGWRGRNDQRSVRPRDVGETALVLRTVLRATPRRVRGEIEIALPDGVAVGIRAALEVLALGPEPVKLFV